MASSSQKYLIWDFDGTLAWRPGGWTGALLKVFNNHAPNDPVTTEQIRPYLQSGFPWHAPEIAHVGMTPTEWWEELMPVFTRAFRGLGISTLLACEYAQEVKNVYLEPSAWRRYNDTFTALEMLSTWGWKHILLSNHVPELSVLLDQLELSAYFTRVFNSAETGYEKPNPKAFHQVMDWMGPDADRWVIGDSINSDILGAQEVDLPAILVRKPHPDAPLFCATLTDIFEKI